MIWIIKSIIGNKTKSERFVDKMQAVTQYRLKLKELAFPDSIIVEILNDGEDNI